MKRNLFLKPGARNVCSWLPFKSSVIPAIESLLSINVASLLFFRKISEKSLLFFVVVTFTLMTIFPKRMFAPPHPSRRDPFRKDLPRFYGWMQFISQSCSDDVVNSLMIYRKCLSWLGHQMRIPAKLNTDSGRT